VSFPDGARPADGVIVLSVVVSPYFFAGFVAICAAFGVLRWGWRVMRGTQP
jgi:hypothetical protein